MTGVHRNNVLVRYDNKYDARSTNKKPCHICEKDFKHNELVYIKKSKKHTNVYHKVCWELLLQ